MCITFIRYHKACQVQALDRRSLPYFGYLQPFCAWYGLVWMTLITLFYGYTVFRSGGWNLEDFFGAYTILGVDVILFIFWKFFKKTKVIKPQDVDLVWERPTIDAYEATFIDPPVGFWREMLQVSELSLSLARMLTFSSWSVFGKYLAAMTREWDRYLTKKYKVLVPVSGAILMLV